MAHCKKSYFLEYLGILVLLVAGIVMFAHCLEQEARIAEREYIFAHWDKVVTAEIRYRAKKEIEEGVK